MYQCMYAFAKIWIWTWESISAFTKCPAWLSLRHANPKHYLHRLEPRLAQDHYYPGEIPLFTSVHTIRLVFCMASCPLILIYLNKVRWTVKLCALLFENGFILSVRQKRQSRVKWRFVLQGAYGILNKGIAGLTSCCCYKSGFICFCQKQNKMFFSLKVTPVLGSEGHEKRI